MGELAYRFDLESLTEDSLEPFFVGWPDGGPSAEKRLSALRGADHVVTAWDSELLVGFVTAVTDGALSAHLPLLEVLPAYQHRGVGRRLVSLVLERLASYYAVDVVCDEELVSFYEELGLTRVAGMASRNSAALTR